MIQKLTLQNFKGIESADIALERLTVIVGPNASGKTSVLQALDLLSKLANPDMPRDDAVQQFGDLSSLLKRGKEKSEAVIQIDGQWRDQHGQLQATFLHPDLAEARQRPTVSVLARWGGQAFDIIDPPRKRRGYQLADRSRLPVVLADWEASTLLRLEARKLAEPSYTESIEPKIGPDGSGLASVLAQMALSRPDDFVALQSALHSVIPQVVRVRLSLAEVTRQEAETVTINDEAIRRTFHRTYSGHRVLFDLSGALNVPSDGASEGTLLVLGLLAVLFSEPKSKLVLLDDLDRGLHPKAQKDLVAQLRKLLEQDPELQIIATSHSPYLVDHLDPKEVRLSTVLPDGTIRFAELTQHPDFERWKEVMRPGEFWSTVGEGWVGSVQEKPRG
jgi:predicted ATPase